MVLIKLIYKHIILCFVLAIISGSLITFFLTKTLQHYDIYAFVYFSLMFITYLPFIYVYNKIGDNLVKKTMHIKESSKYLHHYDINKNPVYFYNNNGGAGFFVLSIMFGMIFGIIIYIANFLK